MSEKQKLEDINGKCMTSHPDIPKGTHPVFTGEYVIISDAIMMLVQNVLFWLSSRSPGSIIYGIYRCGKSVAKKVLIRAIHTTFSEEIPIFSISCTGGKSVNENRFFGDILSGLGLALKNREKPEERRERIIRYLLEASHNANSKKIILFIDEAQNMKPLDYVLLMDIYNRLEDNNINLNVILIGSMELKDTMDLFIAQKKMYIIGRFMINEYNFKGIQTLENIVTCLKQYDSLCYPQDSGCTFTQYFFPQAYEEGYRLMDDAELIFKLITAELEKSIHSPDLNIPMLPFVQTINNCLIKIGFEGECKYKPSSEDWKEAVDMANLRKYRY